MQQIIHIHLQPKIDAVDKSVDRAFITKFINKKKTVMH